MPDLVVQGRAVVSKSSHRPAAAPACPVRPGRTLSVHPRRCAMMVFVRIGVGIVALLLCVATLTDLSAWRSGRPIRGVDHEAAARPGGRHRPSCAGTRRSAAMWSRS